MKTAAAAAVATTAAVVMPVTLEMFRQPNNIDQPKKPLLIVCCGVGKDSIGMLVLLKILGIMPSIILFSDPGFEHPATYAYIPILNRWLKRVGFPPLTVIRARRKRDSSIEAMCLRLGVFASLSYGRHSCSVQWKIEHQNSYLETHPLVIEARREGCVLVKAIGFEAGEEYRAIRGGAQVIADDSVSKENGCRKVSAYAPSIDDGYMSFYPLIERGIDFDGVLDLIFSENLPVPRKSSCAFCAAMTRKEVYELAQEEPHLFFRSLVLERVVQRNRVKPAGRVRGIAFGTPWADYDFAKAFLSRIDEVIELFGLDRAVADGIASPKNEEWRPKALRVEKFREAFATGERFVRFMTTGEIEADCLPVDTDFADDDHLRRGRSRRRRLKRIRAESAAALSAGCAA